MTTIEIAAKVYSIEGVTDERTDCDCCGRSGLKRTVVLLHNESGEYFFYGTTCAAKASGMKATAIERAATTADTDRKNARRAAIDQHPAMIQQRAEIAAANAAGVAFRDRPIARWNELERTAAEAVAA